MAVIENTTMTTDIKLQAREIDFISRFNDTWDALREILGIMRPIRKTPGTKLVSVKATSILRTATSPRGKRSRCPRQPLPPSPTRT